MRWLLKYLLTGFLFAFLGAAPGFSQTLEGAIDKYNQRNYSGALADWGKLAEMGNHDAWFNLGQMYRLGQGISFDFPKAIENYTLAAVAGHTAAQRELGNLYFFTIGTDAAREQAIPWWKKAAANGDPKAQYILGILFFNGDVVEKDQVLGFAWTLLAMDGGVPEALQSNTAMRGQLTEAQLAEAVKMAPKLMTGTPNQGLYSVLIGEPFPKPRTIVAALNGKPIPEEKLAEISESQEKTDMEPTTTPPPLELPETTVVAESQALKPLPENQFSETRREAMETSHPEAEEIISGPDFGEITPASENDLAVEGKFEETQMTAGPENLDPGQAYDLGDPLSPLVDDQGFDGAWSLQLTSFRKPENADAHWREVSSQYPDLFAPVTKKILRFDLGEDLGVYYRLRIGPFLDRAEAEAKCQEIKDAGLDCLVIWP